ncbi:hypothetical protein LJC18_00265 [Lachnospiraceae bacterium OttesenSCG-928-E19]|nr:hypothetical protein [Lachnospiraceae bacterium OttesenSCG-928-E19]
MKKLLVLFLLPIVFLSACTFQTKQRGYIFPDDLESQMASVKTTKQLEDKLGSPLVKTVYGDPVWVYYGALEHFRGPLPVIYDDKTVLLAWVNGERVSKIQILHDEDLPKVRLDKGETQIPAAIELNAIQELFNNVGRFTPAGLGN